jgi:hypothetical protein
MFAKSLLRISILFMASGAVPALAMDCPTLGYDQVGKLLTAASTCDGAMQLLLACQLGASGDVGLSQIVINKCEADFLASLAPRARRGYQRKLGACGRRFADQSGSLYQSIRAICAADVAHSYATKVAKAKKR